MVRWSGNHCGNGADLRSGNGARSRVQGVMLTSLLAAALTFCAVQTLPAWEAAAQSQDDQEPSVSALADEVQSIDLGAGNGNALSDMHAQSAQALGLKVVAPSGFCSIFDLEDYAGYTRMVYEQMRRSSNHVIDIAVPCDSVDLIHRPPEEQTGFPQWIILASYLSEDGKIVENAQMEPEAFFENLLEEIKSQENTLDALLSEDSANRPTFSEPVTTGDAIYWPLLLELNNGPQSTPVRGVAAVTLVDRTPLAAYWYANQAQVPRPFDDILEDQKGLVGDLIATNGEYRSPRPWFLDGPGFTVTAAIIGGLAGLLLSIGALALWRRSKAA